MGAVMPSAPEVAAVSPFLNWQENNSISVPITRLHNIYTIKILKSSPEHIRK